MTPARVAPETVPEMTKGTGPGAEELPHAKVLALVASKTAVASTRRRQVAAESDPRPLPLSIGPLLALPVTRTRSKS